MYDDDKTQVLTEGTEDYPLDATLAANPEPCPNCQAEIAIASQFCSKCGYQRGTWGAPGNAAAQDEPGNQPATALYYLVNNTGRFGIPEGETIVGRGDVGLKLDDGYLSRQHAKFTATADSLGVTDLGSANGSFVEGERLEANEPVALIPGQSLKLGQTSYSIEKAEAEPEAEPVGEQVNPTEELEVAVEVVAEGLPGDSISPWRFEYGEGQVIELQIGETTLGRNAAKADVVVAGDGFISSLHLKITATMESLDVEDLGSTNGTKLNGERLEANTPTALATGDTLQVGETQCVVVVLENSNCTSPNEGHTEAVEGSGGETTG